MATPLKPLLIAVAIAGAGLTAQAQPAAGGHGGPMGHHQRMDPAKMQEMVAKRQAALKAQLKLGDHDSPVHAGERKGNKLALESTTPGMAVHYDLEFKGEQVTGSFTFNGESGTVSGKLRS